jgi:hypothetical protein
MHLFTFNFHLIYNVLSTIKLLNFRYNLRELYQSLPYKLRVKLYRNYGFYCNQWGNFIITHNSHLTPNLYVIQLFQIWVSIGKLIV